MSENNSSRRSFLQFLGLAAGSTLVSSSALATFTNTDDIKKLNPEQQEFMIRYGRWMEEFMEVIRIQKTDPDNMDNNHIMISLTEQAEKLNPELSLFMKDENFALIYHASIQKMRSAI
ncbi:MAG TPA: hypothetical protein PKD91_10850 [Bacteroidia bacterium]|nr:hypothetical protein [Bacteroidia bacterium]